MSRPTCGAGRHVMPDRARPAPSAWQNCRRAGLPFAPMSYLDDEKVRAAAWKRTTGTLPAEARAPACYIDQNGRPKAPPVDFCLPAPYAALSLLPEFARKPSSCSRSWASPGTPASKADRATTSCPARSSASTLWGRWSATLSGSGGAFGRLLGIAEVLQIEPGRYLTFEYIGPTDFFGEAPDGDRVRGAHCTSVDAAFLHRALDGVIELVLLEWKYTESYRVRKPSPDKDAVRLNRYGQAVNDPTGPIRGELLPFELLLDEPFYQLVRQQLLAHALEKAGAEGAGRGGSCTSSRRTTTPTRGPSPVRSSMRWARQSARSGTSSSGTPTGSSPSTAGSSSIREITSREYVLRHARDVVHDQDELLSAFGLTSAGHLEDVLWADHELDGDVRVDHQGGRAGRRPRGRRLELPVHRDGAPRPGRGARGGAGLRIDVVQGDITVQHVEAIVTAGNAALRGGSGVNGAVHAAAGPQLLRASRALAPCPAGSAVITPAFDLAPVKWVIHAVGPVYTGPADDAVIASAYTSSLARADEAGARAVALPSISTGVYGYPAGRAAVVSVTALRDAVTSVESVLLVAFSRAMAELWNVALRS